jgi:hypothetical protein
VSDSILYLAIVAIWAVFLIPAWVRRPHTSTSEIDAETAEYEAEGSTGELPGVPADSVVARTTAIDFEADVRVDAYGEHSEYRYDVHMHSYDAAGSRLDAEPAHKQPARGPSQSRQQMMRARRRMLTILTSLVFITAAFVVTGYVKWWICVPPVGLLVLYVLLLREIAMADAELARKRSAWEARAARDVWRRAHQAWEADREAAAEPTAEVIDISGRVRDQLYDQYADAAVRAVGD